MNNMKNRAQMLLTITETHLLQEEQSLCGYVAWEPSGEGMSNCGYRDSNQTRVKAHSHMGRAVDMAPLWQASPGDGHTLHPPLFPVHTQHVTSVAAINNKLLWKECS